MTILPDARKRIFSMKIALAFGLAPMLMPALSVADRGLLVTKAQAADCADTRHVVFQAVRPSGNGLVTYMPEITLSDDDVYHRLWPSGTQCGPYDRVTDFQLMSSQSSVMRLLPYDFRVVHEDMDGDRVETGFSTWSDSEGQTDFFNGRNPRGLWQVSRIAPPGTGSSGNIEYFRLSLALAEDAEPIPGVAETDESEEVDGEGEEDAPTSDDDETQTSDTSGSGGATGGSSGSTGGGTIPAPENDTEASESTEEKMISPEPAIVEDEDEEQTFGQLSDMTNDQDTVLVPDLADLVPTSDPEDSSQFMPEGEVEPITGGNLEVPAWIEAGLDFTVRWNDRLSQSDRVTIVPHGAPEEEVGSGRQNARVGPRSSRSLLAPNELGTYEVRYISSADNSVYARLTVEVRDPYIELEVDEQLHAGLSFNVTWDRRISQSDRVTIVPHGAPENELGSGGQNVRIGPRSSRPLNAPDELGIYEVRYWRNQQERVVGSALVEVIDPEITLDVPDTAIAGQDFTVEWGDSISQADRITIVPLGTPDDVLGSGGQNNRVGGRARTSLQAPDELGPYEVRYWRSNQERVVGRAIVDIVDPDVIVMAPLEVEAGSDFRVIWNEAHAQSDRITIVPVDAPDDELGSGRQNIRVANRTSSTLRAPSEQGEFEVRYFRNTQGRVAGRALVTVVPEGSAVASADQESGSTQDLIALMERLVELAANLDEAPSEEYLDIRRELLGFGPPGFELIVEFVDDGRIEPWQAAGFMGGSFNPPPPPTVRHYTGFAPPAGGVSPMPPQTGAQPEAQPQAQAQASAQPGELSLEDERRIIMLITRLEGVSPDEQQPIIDELVGYGPAATDLLLKMMQQGLIYRPLALRAAAAIESDGEAPAPQMQAQPSHQAATPEPAQQPAAQQTSGYQVIGVAPDDMLNVRDRTGVSGSTVIGQLAPDARDVVRSGDVQNVDGRDWWHVRHPTLPEQGGWVNSRFLSAQAGLPPQEQAYRVTGVAADERLNIRSHAGVETAILASVAPDATGLRWTGESVALSSGTWWEIAHPELPGGTGWVNSRFLEAQEGVAVASVADPALADQRPAFTEAEGYAAVDADPAVNRLLDTLPPTSSIFPPGNELSPLTKAVLILENEEGVADHARYRIRYGLEQRSGPPGSAGAQPVPFSFVQVDRFNLGEVFREAVAESFGEGRTPPAEAFGAGEHVSYRFEFRPIQGRVADLVAMSRQVVANRDAQGMECLTLMCLHLGSVGEGAITWHDDAGHGTGFDRPYEDMRNRVYTPAAMMDVLTLETGVARIIDGQLIWTGFEESESVIPGEPFMETIMDVNLAQDYGIEAVLRWGNLMDDSVAAIWKRAMTFPSGDAEPHLVTERFFVCARGEPGAQGLCP